MADKKFTDLTAVTTTSDDGSLFCIAEYDGVSVYTSKKLTITQAKALFGNAPTSTDNAIVRYDGTAGQVQNSGITIDDNNAISIPSSASGTPSKLIFNSSGTNKTVIDDSSGTQAIICQATGGIANNEFSISADGTTLYSEGFMYVNSNGAAIGFDDDTPGTILELSSTQIGASVAGSEKLLIDGTGIGFFGAAAVAKPEITGSRGGNAALADLLTDLASLGLITDSTTA